MPDYHERCTTDEAIKYPVRSCSVCHITRSVQLVVKGQVEKYSTAQNKGQLTALQIHYPNYYQVALADNSRRGCSSSSEFVTICDTGDCMKHTR